MNLRQKWNKNEKLNRSRNHSQAIFEKHTSAILNWGVVLSTGKCCRPHSLEALLNNSLPIVQGTYRLAE